MNVSVYVCMYAGIQRSHLGRQNRQFVIDVRVHIWKPHLQTESLATPTCHELQYLFLTFMLRRWLIINEVLRNTS